MFHNLWVVGLAIACWLEAFLWLARVAVSSEVKPTTNAVSTHTERNSNLKTNMILWAARLAHKESEQFQWSPNAALGQGEDKEAINVLPRFALWSPVIPSGMVFIPAKVETAMVHNGTTTQVFVADFYMDEVEVTLALWNKVANWGKNNNYPDIPVISAEPVNVCRTNHPATRVSWYDSVKWCNARSELEGLIPVYYTDRTKIQVYRSAQLDINDECVSRAANGYRLPTEVEWELASRGGLKEKFYPWGDDFLDGMLANYWKSGDPFDNGTTPVGYYDGHQVIQGSTNGVLDMANGFGLYDMAGNVAEWCWEKYYDPVETRKIGKTKAPVIYRIVRGGSWRSKEQYQLLCGYRDYAAADLRRDDLGFRTVRRR